MKKKSVRSFYYLLLTVLAAVIIVISFSIKADEEYNASLNDIGNGIFNPTEWKCKIIEATVNKIDDLELPDIFKDVITSGIENIEIETDDEELDELIETTKDILIENSDDIEETLSDLFGLFETEESREQIDDILKNIPEVESAVEDLLTDEDDPTFKETLNITIAKFLNTFLDTKRASNNYNLDCSERNIPDRETELRNQVLLGLVIFFFILILFYTIYSQKYYPDTFENYKIRFIEDTIFAAIIALIIGVVTPMMKIDARIINFTIHFINEPITFDNQVIFFRTKSILEVVMILLTNNPFVAIMILSFSVLFPLIKLLSSLSVLYSKMLRKNKSLNWIIQNIGKWSMADVFVVAIFLATLGYDGIISDQIQSLTQIENANAIVNTDASTLQLGFYFFLFYCILSIISSKMIKEVYSESDENTVSE